MAGDCPNCDHATKKLDEDLIIRSHLFSVNMDVKKRKINKGGSIFLKLNT